jgi:hypothetical protein
MKVWVLLALLSCAIAVSPVFKSLNKHVGKHLLDAQVIPSTNDKFPFEAILAGAKLSKIIYHRIKKNDSSAISNEEFASAVEKKSTFPLGAVLASKKVSKYILNRVKENQYATLEDIMANSTFPWKAIVKAANVGRTITERIKAAITDGKLGKIINKQIDPIKEIKKTNLFKKMVNKNTRMILNKLKSEKKPTVVASSKPKEQIIVNSDSTDESKCKQCKIGCEILPQSIQSTCFTQCEKAICRDKQSAKNGNLSDVEDANPITVGRVMKVETDKQQSRKVNGNNKCALCTAACHYINIKAQSCDLSCKGACAQK